MPERKPHPFWSPAVAGVVILVPGLLALMLNEVLLFASLGPTAVMLAHSPDQRSVRPYSVLTSHMIGLGTAFLAVTIFGLADTPSVFVVGDVSAARVGAAVMAIMLGTSLEIMLRAPHAPAASTTLLAALGSFHPTWHDTD